MPGGELRSTLQTLQIQIEECSREREAETVYQIKNAPNTRQDLARVLNLQTTLENRLGQVTYHRSDRNNETQPKNMGPSQPRKPLATQSVNGERPSYREEKRAYVAMVQKAWNPATGEKLDDQEREWALSQLESEKKRYDDDMARSKAQSDGLALAIEDFKKL